VRTPREPTLVDGRVALLCALAAALGVVAAGVARGLSWLIAAVTQLAYFGRLSGAPASPATNALGIWAVAVPVAGGLLVGLLARFGSRGIRGHGIPEAMEQVLQNRSRIPLRLALLKPLSAAVAIGTGGPFGAEGPIIATGGALGSALGQALTVTAHERKTLLAAGAAAGMAATFGTPAAAVLLAVELLLFEYRPRSLIPVALASTVAAAVRAALFGSAAAFAVPALPPGPGASLVGYVAVGALAGLASVPVTRAVYAVEDGFARLPIHWMWWPALGGIAVGALGLLAPRTLGVGYDNIEDLVSGRIAGAALAALCLAKLASWTVALGSGTSGGTLAPLLTLGAGLGAAAGGLAAQLWPALGLDPRLAAVVGMAALFAGASRALLASALFAFEATRQPAALLPLLGGCAAAYLTSALLMRHSIMTEKIARRGTRVLSEYAADFLEQVGVADYATRPAVTLPAAETAAGFRARLAEGLPAHRCYPVIDAGGRLAGVVAARDLLRAGGEGRTIGELAARPAVVVYEDSSLREAADQMVRHGVGRLPVVRRADPERVVGVLTRADLLAAHGPRMDEAHRAEPGLVMATPWTPRQAG
jgi:H+/Cl- antiporter ClcA